MCTISSALTSILNRKKNWLRVKLVLIMIVILYFIYFTLNVDYTLSKLANILSTMIPFCVPTIIKRNYVISFSPFPGIEVVDVAIVMMDSSLCIFHFRSSGGRLQFLIKTIINVFFLSTISTYYFNRY